MQLAADSAVMCFPESRLGIFPGAAGTVLLPHLIGPARAKELIYTGRRFSAREAADWGLVNRVAPASELRASALDLAGTIARNGPLGIRGAKRVVDRSVFGEVDAALRFSLAERMKLNGTRDFAEALQAFEDGREPQFTGA